MSPRADLSRVVITGLGAITPLGSNVGNSWRRLVAGDQAVAPLRLFDITGCRCQMAAEVNSDDLPRPFTKHWPRASQLGYAAACEALSQSGLLNENGHCSQAHLVVSLSTTGGGMEFGEEFVRQANRGQRKRQLGRVARYQPQQTVVDLQKALGFSGPSTILTNACASGAQAIGHAYDLLRAGETDCVLAGGVEALSELIYVGFDGLQALSVDLCRPFDLNRSGLLLGEAGGFLVLESEKRARERGVEVLGFVCGYGHSTDLHHLTQPHPSGSALVQAMTRAVQQAGVEPSHIGYVNAHGTGTPMNDGAEAAAFQSFFGPDLGPTRISSTKPAIGHTLGAAGAVESIFTVLSLLTSELPPQLNCRNPLPGMESALVQQGERLGNGGYVLNVNLGFGGANAALLFSRE